MILYGASGHAKVVIDILEKSNQQINSIIDDDENIKSILNYKVSTFYKSMPNSPIIICIGNNKIREKISIKLNDQKFGTAIHPKAIIAKSSKINEGSVIMANATINSDSFIGKHCIINTNAVVEHDCSINDYVHISPNATLCGNVKIGNGTHIGAGATIIPNIVIGKWCTIGAGSVIIKDIPDNTIVVGNPGRVLKKKKNER